MSRTYEYRPGTHSYRTFFNGQMEFETFNEYNEIVMNTHGEVTMNVNRAIVLRNALDVWLIGREKKKKIR